MILRSLFEFFLTLLWFTVLPVQRICHLLERGIAKQDVQYSISYYQYIFLTLVPGIKLTIAWVIFLVFRVLFNDVVASVVFSLAYVGLSGGIHLEGFCDTVDALYKMGSAEERYKVIRDPHIGAIGMIHTVWVILALLTGLSYSAYKIGGLEEGFQWWALGALGVFLTIPVEIVFKILLEHMEKRDVFEPDRMVDINMNLGEYTELCDSWAINALLTLGLVCIPLAILKGMNGAVGGLTIWSSTSLVVFGLGWKMHRFFTRRLGFVNGDCLGYTIVVYEVVFVTMFAIGLKLLEVNCL